MVIAGIVAPLAASFISQKWARYLYAAPLAGWALAWFAIQREVDQLLARLGGLFPGALKISADYGIYIAGLASLVVAARLLKRPASETARSVTAPLTDRVRLQ